MDRRTRIYDPEETLRMALDNKQAQIWTALPALVQSFNPTAMTCVVQPTVSGLLLLPDGTYKEVKMPLLLDCPVMFPSGGGATLTFPIKKNDECLVIFASRCIDSWWQLGGVRGQFEYRMHDISDGFAFVGVRSKPRAFNVDINAAQLRSDDGTAYVQLNPTTKNINVVTPANITANASGTITATAPNVIINGNVQINGNLNVSGTTISGGISLTTHLHTGVVPGGGNTGQPI